METQILTEADVVSLLKREIERGRSLTDLAGELDLDPGTVSRVLNGKRPPGRTLLRALAQRYPELKIDLALFLLG